MASAKETNSAKEKTVSVWGDKVHPKVRIIGSGAPLVYLHGGYGPIETELLDELAKSFTVYAPEHPGITAGDEDSYKALDDMWDLVLYYYDLFDKLGLKSPAVVGHSFGGTGAIEAISCVQAIRHQLIHPTINYETPDPQCDLDYVPNVARHAKVQHTLSNSFGLGGQNACLVMAKYSEGEA